MKPANYQQIQLRFPCPVNFNELSEADEIQWFCNNCNRTVYDLRSKSFEKFLTLHQKTSGHFCAIYPESADIEGTINKRNEVIRLSRFLLVLVVVFGTSFFRFANARDLAALERVRMEIARPVSDDSVTVTINFKGTGVTTMNNAEATVYLGDSIYGTGTIINGKMELYLPAYESNYLFRIVVTGYNQAELLIKLRLKTDGLPRKNQYNVKITRRLYMIGFL